MSPEVMFCDHCTPLAAATSQGRKFVDAAERADSGGRVDQDPAGAHRVTVPGYDVVIVGIDRRGVAQTAMLGHQDSDVDAMLCTAGAHQPEHRHELFLDQRMCAQLFQIGGQRGQQDLGRRRH